MERLDGVALEKWWEKMWKAYVMRILNLDCAFESAPYGQIGSSYVKEDVVDTSAVPGEPDQGGLEPAEDMQIFGGSLGEGEV